MQDQKKKILNGTIIMKAPDFSYEKPNSIPGILSLLEKDELGAIKGFILGERGYLLKWNG